MSKWEHRDRKLSKKKKAPQYFKTTPHKDKFDRRDIKEARKNKESIWDNFDSEDEE